MGGLIQRIKDGKEQLSAEDQSEILALVQDLINEGQSDKSLIEESEAQLKNLTENVKGTLKLVTELTEHMHQLRLSPDKRHLQDDSIEKSCRRDLEEHHDKILRAKLVMGYRGNDSVEVTCDPPALVRVTQKDDGQFINWTTHDFADPNWDVELVKPHPALEGVRSLWVDGISRSRTGEVEHPDWEIVSKGSLNADVP
jgi:hypothetical protein